MKRSYALMLILAVVFVAAGCPAAPDATEPAIEPTAPVDVPQDEPTPEGTAPPPADAPDTTPPPADAAPADAPDDSGLQLLPPEQLLKPADSPAEEEAPAPPTAE